jgi:hypothetical protein
LTHFLKEKRLLVGEAFEKKAGILIDKTLIGQYASFWYHLGEKSGISLVKPLKINAFLYGARAQRIPPAL